MKALRVGLIQLRVSDDPERHLPETETLIREAAGRGATMVMTPEGTNFLTTNRTRRKALLKPEAEDATLARLSGLSRELGVWTLIGGLGLATSDQNGRFANRSLLLDDSGKIRARYDKIHMFDAEVSETERYHESAVSRPGDRAVLARTPWGGIGMTICYDVRFPALYAALARVGATILTVPSAFTRPTGAAHWETLLRARAIETGAFVLAPAQCGIHPAAEGDRPRASWGHSLAVSPWGEILADGGEEPGATMVDLDLDAPAAARRRIPALEHVRAFRPPETAG